MPCVRSYRNAHFRTVSPCRASPIVLSYFLMVLPVSCTVPVCITVKTAQSGPAIVYHSMLLTLVLVLNTMILILLIPRGIKGSVVLVTRTSDDQRRQRGHTIYLVLRVSVWVWVY